MKINSVQYLQYKCYCSSKNDFLICLEFLSLKYAVCTMILYNAQNMCVFSTFFNNLFQVVLLKAGCFEILLLQLCQLIDTSGGHISLASGQTYTVEQLKHTSKCYVKVQGLWGQGSGLCQLIDASGGTSH